MGPSKPVELATRSFEKPDDATAFFNPQSLTGRRPKYALAPAHCRNTRGVRDRIVLPLFPDHRYCKPMSWTGTGLAQLWSPIQSSVGKAR
jgi:hypothetical protein